MNRLTRLVIVAAMGGVLFGTYHLAATGVGLDPLDDAEFREDLATACEPEQRGPDGKCPQRVYRSYFFSPLYYGGPGVGK
jgi:hypothetical protein